MAPAVTRWFLGGVLRTGECLPLIVTRWRRSTLASEMRIASQQAANEYGPMIVGIIGGSGCGKSWLAQRLLQGLGANNAAMVCQDSFYRDLSHLAPRQR